MYKELDKEVLDIIVDNTIVDRVEKSSKIKLLKIHNCIRGVSWQESLSVYPNFSEGRDKEKVEKKLSLL